MMRIKIASFQRRSNMTVKEFYEYCVEKHIENFEVYVDQISVNGCFIGYDKLTNEKIDIGYGEKIISLG